MARIEPCRDATYYTRGKGLPNGVAAQSDHSNRSHVPLSRYNPYSRSGTPQYTRSPSNQPRLLPSHIQDRSQPQPSLSNQLALSPQLYNAVTDSHSSPTSPKTKAYETTRPTNLYQPSRGAQRDAKWHARYIQRNHLVQKSQLDRQRHDTQLRAQIHQHHSHHALPDVEKIRREQQAAIAAARHAHAEHVQKSLAAEAKDQADRKMRRVQLQVFVHARPTFCIWDGCQAVLNSWAVLEKHILHAHLHPMKAERGEHDLIACKWDGCGKEFLDPTTCYKHCLIGHMSQYSARCPFNCLYEGPIFAELMAHISRRHPDSTPDDFVPGLIHHYPEHLPPHSKLPRLPQYAKIQTYYDPSRSPLPETGFVTPLIAPYSSGTTGGNLKVRRLITRLCVSGKRPRKEHFGDKIGASAAIDAILENSKRVSLATQQSDMVIEGNAPISAEIRTASSAGALEMGIELVDIRKRAREAKKSALALEDGIADGYATDSVGGSRPPSRSGEEVAVPKPRLLVRIATGLLNKQTVGDKREEDGDIEESDQSTDSEQSKFSEYRAAGDPDEGIVSPGGEGEVKRSERLRKKLLDSENGTPSHSPAKPEFWR